MKQVIKEEGSRPIKIWTDEVEESALTQLKNLARLPFIAGNGVAAMPDVHMGKGASVGTVIATDKAIIPSAVGVDIGCGMNAVRLSLKAADLPDSLKAIRDQIERDIPLGAGGAHQNQHILPGMNERQRRAIEGALYGEVSSVSREKFCKKAAPQIGTLGGGNHFIELCVDENQDVWIMLHSGSRGIGNMIGTYFIEKAKRRMEQYFIHLPDGDLAYLPEDTDDFNDYIEAVGWAQNYALENRRVMMGAVIAAIRRHLPVDFTVTQEAINCFPGTVNVSAEDINKVYRRWYDGRMVTLKTKSGKSVPVTPNHPLLTERGWMRADAVQKCDKLICASSTNMLTTGINPHVGGNPPAFSQLFDALSDAGHVERVFGGAVKFHSDVDPIEANREVEVVSANGKLGYGIHTAFFKQARKLGFLSTDFASSDGFGDRLLREFTLGNLSNSSSGLSGSCESGTIFGAHLGESVLQGAGPGANLDTGIAENLRDTGLTDSGFRTEGEHGNSVGVFLDEVIEIEVGHFAGHVYNLSCNSEWYLADGIISHNCHHNYVERENHFGRNLWVTRKGAIRARVGDLGIIPGSMGQKSYIVRGKGDLESYCSCSHGAGRKMSRAAARKQFTVADLEAQTTGVECRKDDAVLDEIPGSYKDIDQVMENQSDLVEVIHVLKQVLCVKGA